jgi:hypothetical protein
MQACDRCHGRKSRCNKQRPTCDQCQKAEAGCTYTDRSKDPLYRRSQIEALERKLRQTEARNAALSSELARARATTAARALPASTPENPASPHTTSKSASGSDVIHEVSFLASTAAGDRHYLGSTSGVLFASLVRASVDVTSEPQPNGPGLVGGLGDRSSSSHKLYSAAQCVK